MWCHQSLICWCRLFLFVKLSSKASTYRFPSLFPQSLKEKKKKRDRLCQDAENGLEVKSYGPCWHKGELESGRKKKKNRSCVHQSTCAGVAQNTNGVVADVVWIMSGGGAWNPSASRVSVTARERWERKGRLFFLFIQEYQLFWELPVVLCGAGWICPWIFLHWRFSLISRGWFLDFHGKKGAFCAGVKGITFWQHTDKSLEGYFWNECWTVLNDQNFI